MSKRDLFGFGLVTTLGVPLILQRRIAKYVVWPFAFGREQTIAVGSWQYVVRFKLFAKINLVDESSL